jgi:transposase
MINGVEDPKELAAMAKGKLRKKTKSLEDALQGQMGPHQRQLIEAELEHLDFLDKKIMKLDIDIAQRLKSHEQILKQIDTISGIGQRAAEEIIVEAGHDKVSYPECSSSGFMGQNMPRK